MKLSTEEVALLRSLVEWRRANGWGFTHCGLRDEYWWLKGVWRVFVYDEVYEGNRYMVLRVDDKAAKAGLTQSWPRSVREAVDVLCALQVLPLKFSSAFSAGRESAYTEDEWRVCAGPDEFPAVFQDEIYSDEYLAIVLRDARNRWRSETIWVQHRRSGATDWSRVDELQA